MSIQGFGILGIQLALAYPGGDKSAPSSGSDIGMDSQRKHKLEIIDFGRTRKDIARLLLCQPTWNEQNWTIEDGLYFLNSGDDSRAFVERALINAKDHSVDLIVFPELSISENILTLLAGWANQNDCIIIAGSHYTERRLLPWHFVGVFRIDSQTIRVLSGREMRRQCAVLV